MRHGANCSAGSQNRNQATIRQIEDAKASAQKQMEGGSNRNDIRKITLIATLLKINHSQRHPKEEFNDNYKNELIAMPLLRSNAFRQTIQSDLKQWVSLSGR